MRLASGPQIPHNGMQHSSGGESMGGTGSGQLSRSIIAAIKRQLWQRVSQAEIATIFGVNQSTISRIKAGEIGGVVPWPDGSEGRLPSRDAKDVRSEWLEDARRYRRFPEEMKVLILARVNAERADNGAELIPAVADEMALLLTNPIADTPAESRMLAEAKVAEDRRCAEVMREFDELVKVNTARRSQERIVEIIDQTQEDRSGDAPPARMPGPPQYTKMEWQEVIARSPAHAAVKRGLKTKDAVWIEAVCIVAELLKHTPSAWKEPVFLDRVRSVERTLRAYPDLCRRIAGVHNPNTGVDAGAGGVV